MSDDLDARIRKALPGIGEDIVLHNRANWQETNIMRRILIAENERMISEARLVLETCPLDKVEETRGIIKGLHKANATINSVGVKPRQNT